MRMSVISLAGFLAILAGCASPSSQSFDPEDPAAVAAIESIMAATIQAAGEVDPVKVLEPMGGGEEFTLVTGDVMLVDLQEALDAFTDTYDGLQKQDHTVYETRVRLLSPDVAVYSSVGEGTYTDLAGWTSEPVGLGISVVFVREDGRWVGRHVHQSIAY